MKKEYLIRKITSGEDDHYGDICIVKANPVETNSMGMRFVSESIGKGTETFFFPNESDIIETLLRIARGQGIWQPNEDDFEEETVCDEKNNRDMTVYRHVSFWSNDYDHSLNSGNKAELINNKQHKANQLKTQYYRNGWYESIGLREYVESLAESDNGSNFWEWLFDNPSLNGLMPWNLPSDYTECYEDFLKLFD